jgi:hypothetical protein
MPKFMLPETALARLAEDDTCKLNFSVSCTLIIHLQHALSFRLILYWKQASSFRLILHWKRLVIYFFAPMSYRNRYRAAAEEWPKRDGRNAS